MKRNKLRNLEELLGLSIYKYIWRLVGVLIIMFLLNIYIWSLIFNSKREQHAGEQLIIIPAQNIVCFSGSRVCVPFQEIDVHLIIAGEKIKAVVEKKSQ